MAVSSKPISASRPQRLMPMPIVIHCRARQSRGGLAAIFASARFLMATVPAAMSVSRGLICFNGSVLLLVLLFRCAFHGGTVQIAMHRRHTKPGFAEALC